MTTLPLYSERLWLRLLATLACILLLCSGCSPKINIMRDHSEPLKEYTLQGEGRDKILLVHLRGFISSSPGTGLLSQDPSEVQEIAARLRKAADDDNVKAVVLAIDSPGGSVTASDILYQQIRRHREETGQNVVALLMGVAASGGYYAAAAAETIIAHPTTVTGSVGTIFIRPDLAGLMHKIGVQAEVTKSGKYKDISSWFRHSSEEEREMLQKMIDQLNARFLEVVRTSRKLDDTRLTEVAKANVFTASQAMELGLVDSVGYAQDAFDKAAALAGMDKDPKVVTYRRQEFADDTPYNTLTNSLHTPELGLLDGASRILQALEPGFHHLWLPGSALQ